MRAGLTEAQLREVLLRSEEYAAEGLEERGTTSCCSEQRATVSSFRTEPP